MWDVTTWDHGAEEQYPSKLTITAVHSSVCFPVFPVHFHEYRWNWKLEHGVSVVKDYQSRNQAVAGDVTVRAKYRSHAFHHIASSPGGVRRKYMSAGGRRRLRR